MDSSYLPADGSPTRRELQGPRPTPLKIRKDSHKIKKPPIAPQLHHHHHHHQQLSQQQHRPPVIIYTVSPKVIHTDANDFMKLVQRLTGPSSSSSSSPTLSSSLIGAPSIERTNNNNTSSSHVVKLSRRDDISSCSMDDLEIMGPTTVERTGGSFPSILSPIPSSLPPISPNFFSPTIDPNSLSFLHDLSPIFNGNFMMMNSPTTFLAAPNNNITSPTPSFDLFNYQFLDL